MVCGSRHAAGRACTRRVRGRAGPGCRDARPGRVHPSAGDSVPDVSAGRVRSANGRPHAPTGAPPPAPTAVVVAATRAAPTPRPTLAPGTYVNPVLDRDFPDPDTLETGGAYYAYATNGNGQNIQAGALR